VDNALFFGAGKDLFLEKNLDLDPALEIRLYFLIGIGN
jgi:hypothetical protein